MPDRSELFHNRYRGQARRYLEKCRRIQHALEQGERIQLDWAGPILDKEGWCKEFRVLLDRRINLKAGYPHHWRKLNTVYQTGLRRDQQRIREIVQWRIVHFQFETPELNKRFAHLLSRREDFRD